MKKIIAISVMFALIAGAVFADSSVGGSVETRFYVAHQEGADGDDPLMGGKVAGAELVLSGSNSDGTLGGRWRFRNTNFFDPSNGNPENFYDQAYVWWKPIEQVKIFLGIDQDGMFGTDDFMGWGFHAGDNDFLFNHCWDFWRQIFPGNWDTFGLAFSFYLVPGLDINLVLPSGAVNWPNALESKVTNQRPITDPSGATNVGMLPGHLRLTANYNLDFGKISLVYLGGGQVAEKGAAWIGSSAGNIAGDNNGLIGLSALITAIEGIQIKVGGSVILTDPDMIINAGLGVVYSGDGFGVKFRVGMFTQGDRDLFLTANILPFFAVGEKGQVLVDIGITNDGAQDPALGWSVVPAYRLGIDGGAFKIGLQVYSNTNWGGNCGISGADYVKWAVPMSLSFNF